tara:strand:- start:1021 stop:1536 length:516 start_codon:yes stop_codon:yes gene_type:complete
MLLLDDVILEEDVLDFDKDEEVYVPEKWYDLDTNHKYQKTCLFLIDKVRNYYDLSTIGGYEFWIHHNTRPQQWHIDKDERMMDEKGILSCPLCSIVYYPLVEDLRDGRLHLLDENLQEDVIIVPKQNRLVALPTARRHFVEPFTRGRRVAFIVNPWDRSKYLYPDPNLKIL